jgi:hypothetical protein
LCEIIVTQPDIVILHGNGEKLLVLLESN